MKNPLKDRQGREKKIRIGKKFVIPATVAVILLLILGLWQFGIFDTDLGEGAGKAVDGQQTALKFRQVVNGQDLVSPVRSMEPQTLKRWWVATWIDQGNELIVGSKMLILTKGFEGEQNPSQRYELSQGTPDNMNHGLMIHLNIFYLPKQSQLGWGDMWGDWEKNKKPAGSIFMFDDWSGHEVAEASKDNNVAKPRAFVTGMFDSGDSLWMGEDPTDWNKPNSGFRWGDGGAEHLSLDGYKGTEAFDSQLSANGMIQYTTVLPHRDAGDEAMIKGWWNEPVTDPTRYNFFAPFEDRWHWTTAGGGVGWLDKSLDKSDQWPLLYFMLHEGCPLFEEAAEYNYKMRVGVYVQASIAGAGGRRIYSQVERFRIKAKRVSQEIKIWLDHSTGSMFRQFVFSEGNDPMAVIRTPDSGMATNYLLPDIEVGDN